MYPIFGRLLLISPVIALIIIVMLIVRHRTKVQTRRIEKENDRAALEKIIDTINEDSKQHSVLTPSVSMKKNEQAQKIRMNCQKCGATTDLDADKQILFCPFCGAKELIVESDYIKEARIKASMNEKIAEEKRRTANELFEQYNSSIKVHHREERKDKIHKIIRLTVAGIIGVVVVLAIFFGFWYVIIFVLPELLKNR